MTVVPTNSFRWFVESSDVPAKLQQLVRPVTGGDLWIDVPVVYATQAPIAVNEVDATLPHPARGGAEP